MTFTLTRSGAGRPTLVLHGGGGPLTVAGLAAHLATTAEAILPTHPGWNGTDRPAGLGSIRNLADLYLEYLERENLADVVVVGSSLGGWIAAEMALADAARQAPGQASRIGALVLVDAVGIEVPGEPIRDFFALDARGVAEYSFHDAERFYIDPSTVAPDAAARQQANMVTMKALAGDPYMHDPTLLGRLGGVRARTLVVWGESDRIVTPGYGEAFARAIPDARFECLAGAGHLPQLETPAELFAVVDKFLAAESV